MYVTQNPELSLHIDALLRNERSYSARQLGNTEFAAVEDIKLRAAAARDIKRNRTAGDRINSNCWEGDRFSSLAKIVGVSAWYASLASFRLEVRPFADIRCVKTRDRSEIAQERQPARFGYRLDVQDVALGETIELRKEIELPACIWIASFGAAGHSSIASSPSRIASRGANAASSRANIDRGRGSLSRPPAEFMIARKECSKQGALAKSWPDNKRLFNAAASA